MVTAKNAINNANKFFAVTMYRVVVLTSVGVPLTVQVVLSILKPAGSAGATVQLAIVTKIYSNFRAFVAVKADGSITTWGDTKSGGKNALNAPTDKDYIKVYSTSEAFAALKADGSITVWGDADYGGSGAPSGKGHTKIYSNFGAFATLKADGSIIAWGRSNYGGTGGAKI
jgi:hypothetical protein